MKITMEQLMAADACPSGVSAFERIFGKEVEVNHENADKCVELDLLGYTYWLVLTFLNDEGIEAWDDDERAHEHDGGNPCKGCVNDLYRFVNLYNMGYRKEIK